MQAQRIHDYRVFCTGCDGSCDVRAVDEEDAGREARKKGYVPLNDDVLCPICLKYYQANLAVIKSPGVKL